MNVNLHHLQLFYYVAKAGGISAAVKIIPYGVQQPAISQQIIQLEEDLGTKLFERKPFSLTPAGEMLYKFLAKFFDNLDSEIAMIRDNAGTQIRFGCPGVISAKYFPELIRILIDKFPDIRPQISEVEGQPISAMLLNKEIDIAFSFMPAHRSKSIITRKLAEIPMALVVPENHPFVAEGFWPKSDFAKVKWIAVQEKVRGNQELREGLSQFGISPQIVASTNSIEAALKYVALGLGITLMAQPPPDLIEPYELAAIPVEEIFGSACLSMSYHSTSTINSKVMNYIFDTAKKLSREFIGNQN